MDIFLFVQVNFPIEMSNVFDRLFADSTEGLKNRSNQRLAQQKENDSSQWDLILAAKCHLVDSKPGNFMNKPVEKNSLMTTNLSKGRNRRSIPTTPRLNKSQLRPISVVMSPDGSVERTEWYYVTDSVEPTPYTGPKPKKTKFKSPSKGLSEAEEQSFKPVSDREIIRVKKELSRIRTKQIVWGNSAESACDHKLLQTIRGKKVPKKKKEIEIVNLVKPLDMSKEQKPYNVVSFACRSWEHNGYPNSLSFLLEK